jgi:hypothetical protein
VAASQNSGREYALWPWKEGACFAIEFIHSVNQTPVRDVFRVGSRNGEALIQVLATRFRSFGAGMQTDLGPGQTLNYDGPDLVISGFTHTFTELNYVVGTVSDHILYIGCGEDGKGGVPLSLRNLCGRNAALRILVR